MLGQRRSGVWRWLDDRDIEDFRLLFTFCLPSLCVYLYLGYLRVLRPYNDSSYYHLTECEPTFETPPWLPQQPFAFFGAVLGTAIMTHSLGWQFIRSHPIAAAGAIISTGFPGHWMSHWSPYKGPVGDYSFLLKILVFFVWIPCMAVCKNSVFWSCYCHGNPERAGLRSFVFMTSVTLSVMVGVYYYFTINPFSFLFAEAMEVQFLTYYPVFCQISGTIWPRWYLAMMVAFLIFQCPMNVLYPPLCCKRTGLFIPQTGIQVPVHAFTDLSAAFMSIILAGMWKATFRMREEEKAGHAQ